MSDTPRLWFNKNFSPIVHVLKELSARYSVLASHTSTDSPMLYGDWQTLLEPSGVVGKDYLEYALEICQSKSIDLLIPSKEAGFLNRHKAALEAIGTRVYAVATAEVQKHVEDKAAFYKDFPAVNARMPETKVVQTWDEMQLAITELQSQGHMVCVKPAIGIYGYGFRLITRQEQLKDFLKGDTHRISLVQAEHLFAKQKSFVPMLVMEFLPGAEYSMDCLAKDGILVGAVVREKVGGLGNVQEVRGSLAFPELHQVATDLTRHYQLNGIFNLQFKNDQQQQPCVLEINARPSGGLRFSMTTGFQFGVNMVDLELGRKQPDQIKAPSPDLIRVTEVKEALILQ
jgi:carbamoylphosphate synthase large subunit